MQVFVSLGEVATAEETPICRKGRGMGCFQDQMPLWIDEGHLRSSTGPPEEEDQIFALPTQLFDELIGQLFPAQIPVRAGAPRLNGEGGVEEQDALASP